MYNNLSKFIIRGKDRTTKIIENNVVYKINCNNCDSSYVGQSKRQLQERLDEHQKNLLGPSKDYSVIRQHVIDNNHSMDWLGVEIVDREPNLNKRLVSESIHICKQSSPLNSRKDRDKLHSSYKCVLSRFRRHSFS